MTTEVQTLSPGVAAAQILQIPSLAFPVIIKPQYSLGPQQIIVYRAEELDSAIDGMAHASPTAGIYVFQSHADHDPIFACYIA